MSEKIDIVIPWVDGQDEQWQKSRNQYQADNSHLNGISRYRDFGILKFALRSIEQYVPWVNKIFLITDQQVPNFLEVNHPKIEVIDHCEFIPSQYLPTFNSNVIELNAFRIPNLSEHFILMNDDMIFTQPLDKGDFFQGDNVVDAAILPPLFPRETGIARILANNVSVINHYFSKREWGKKYFWKVYSLKYGVRLFKNLSMIPYSLFSGFYDYHVPIPYIKSIYQMVMEDKAHSYYLRTCNNKFRTELDINHWLVRYWQLASGKFEPRKNNLSRYLLMDQISEIEKCLFDKRVKMLCINDTNEVQNYEVSAKQVMNLLSQKFPVPSSFEWGE